MRVSRGFARGAGGRLPYGPVFQNRERGDQNDKSTRKNETLHRSQAVALSMICSRMFIIVSFPVLSQKSEWRQGLDSLRSSLITLDDCW